VKVKMASGWFDEPADVKLSTGLTDANLSSRIPGDPTADQWSTCDESSIRKWLSKLAFSPSSASPPPIQDGPEDPNVYDEGHFEPLSRPSSPPIWPETEIRSRPNSPSSPRGGRRARHQPFNRLDNGPAQTIETEYPPSTERQHNARRGEQWVEHFNKRQKRREVETPFFGRREDPKDPSAFCRPP
jgi:hypothetical protein